MESSVIRASLPGAWSGVLERAVLETLIYADIFDYPLSTTELHRYLIGQSASLPAVEASLEALRRTSATVERVGPWWTLAGREPLAAVRQARAAHARRLWPVAKRWGLLMTAMPFVRFVGVSGALAMDNVGADADIDYFVITASGRLWTARAQLLVLVRLARRGGYVLCPNYIVSEGALVLRDRTLFTAHELVQLVPLGPLSMYARFRAANPWTAEHLPNAQGPPRPVDEAYRGHRWLQGFAEAAGRTAPCALVERWERTRKIRALGGRVRGGSEASFGPDWCKGHFGEHGKRVLTAHADALATRQVRQP